MSNLQIVVDTVTYKPQTSSSSANSANIYYVAPTSSLYSGKADTSIVKEIACIYMYDSLTAPGPGYVQALFTFQLLGPLLTSAPTQATNDPANSNLFVVFVYVGTSTADYIVDAQIQTKGNSAMSSTYTAKPSPIVGATGNFITFPVTTFFNVSQPGSPYTLTITLSRVNTKTS